MLSDFVLDLQEDSPSRSSQMFTALSTRSMTPSTSNDGTFIKQEKSHECPVCQKAFTRKAIFLDHYRSQHSDERIHCSICNKPFKRQNDRRRHEKLHSGERAFQCQGEADDAHLGCGKRFARLHSLREHQRRKPGTTCFELLTGPRMRQASSVPSEPDSLSDDDEDEAILESIEPVEIAGPPSDYEMDYMASDDAKLEKALPPNHVSIQSAHISWPSVMEAKIRQQAGRALAAAQQNNKTGDMKDSAPSPTSVSLHHCWLCPSRYSSKESFEFHLRHHYHELEQRPYHCSQCGLDFALMGHLSRHIPNCTGTFGLYRCNWGCGRAFSSKEDLHRHANGPDGSRCFENVTRYEQQMKATILVRLKQLHMGNNE